MTPGLLKLPRNADLRAALNRFERLTPSVLPELKPALGTCATEEFIARRIERAGEKAVLAAVRPLVATAHDILSSDPAWSFLLDYGWLCNDLAASKPSFAQLALLGVPGDWDGASLLIGNALDDLLFERQDATWVRRELAVARDLELVKLDRRGSDARRRLSRFDDVMALAAPDADLERTFRLTRLLRVSLAIGLARDRTPDVPPAYATEARFAWDNLEEEAREHLVPLFRRALDLLAGRFADLVVREPTDPEDVKGFAALVYLGQAVGHRPVRREIQRIRAQAWASVQNQIKCGQRFREWEADVAGPNLHLARSKSKESPTAIVIREALQSKNSYAKTYEALTRPLPIRTIRLATVFRTRETLAREFPWLTELNRIVLDEIEATLWQGGRYVRFAPILLVSPPGIGKTRYARRLGELLNTPMVHVALNGMKSSMSLKGSAAGWADSRPSLFVENLIWQDAANYVVLLDEIDKVSLSDYNGNPLDVLLSLLERENAARFADECLGVKVDLSRLSFIATANDAKRLPPPLLSRFRVVEVEPPSADALAAVVLGTRDDRARELEIDPRMLPLAQDEVEELLAAARSPRHLARLTQAYLVRRELQDVRERAACH